MRSLLLSAILITGVSSNAVSTFFTEASNCTALQQSGPKPLLVRYFEPSFPNHLDDLYVSSDEEDYNDKKSKIPNVVTDPGTTFSQLSPAPYITSPSSSSLSYTTQSKKKTKNISPASFTRDDSFSISLVKQIVGRGSGESKRDRVSTVVNHKKSRQKWNMVAAARNNNPVGLDAFYLVLNDDDGVHLYVGASLITSRFTAVLVTDVADAVPLVSFTTNGQEEQYLQILNSNYWLSKPRTGLFHHSLTFKDTTRPTTGFIFEQNNYKQEAKRVKE